MVITLAVVIVVLTLVYLSLRNENKKRREELRKSLLRRELWDQIEADSEEDDWDAEGFEKKWRAVE